MVKVAKLITGDIICGDIINAPGRERWSHLFFAELAQQDNGKPGMKFIPVIQFGNFDESVIIEDGQIVYSYDPDPEFVKNYRHAIARYQAALNKARQKNKSDILVPTTAEIINIKKRNGNI